MTVLNSLTFDEMASRYNWLSLALGILAIVELLWVTAHIGDTRQILFVSRGHILLFTLVGWGVSIIALLLASRVFVSISYLMRLTTLGKYGPVVYGGESAYWWSIFILSLYTVGPIYVGLSKISFNFSEYENNRNWKIDSVQEGRNRFGRRNCTLCIGFSQLTNQEFCAKDEELRYRPKVGEIVEAPVYRGKFSVVFVDFSKTNLIKF